MIEHLPRPSVLERFRTRWELGANGCHVWTGCRNRAGYGLVQIANRKERAHRVAYVLAHGEIPDDPDSPIVVRHKCDNPPCINPAHLELGTRGDNNRDTASRGRHWLQKVTHCPKGHPYSGENLYANPSGHRQCRECTKAATRAYKARHRKGRCSKPSLTVEQVRAIREEYANGEVAQRQLARKYSVSQATISRAVHGEIR